MTLAISSMEDNDLRDAFILFDVNRDGRITETELESVLGFLGVEATKEEIQRMILDADLNGNGTVEFEEFLRMMKRYAAERAKKNKEILTLETFKVFDHNNDSLIDFEEIKRTMHFLGEAVTDNEVHEMIREADQDKDGYINFEEFKFLMKRLKGRGRSRSKTGRSSSRNNH